MGNLLAKLDVLPGAKSILIVLFGVGLWAGSFLGYITAEDFDKGLQLLTILFGGAMAMKVDRFQKAIADVFAAEPSTPAQPPASGSAAGSTVGLLAVAIVLALFVSGCAFVRFDGAGATQIAQAAVSRQTLPGEVVSAGDCDPIASFQKAMRDEKGHERVFRWLWDDESESEPRAIATLAQIQLDGCNVLRERGSDGQVADRMRATLASFWMNTGLVVGPADPD